MVHKKVLLQYIILCAGNLSNALLLGLATTKANVYACNVHCRHFLDLSIPEPSLCIVFGSVVGAGIIALTKNRIVIISKMITHLCSLWLPVILEITFFVDACKMQCHCNTKIQDFPRTSCNQVDVIHCNQNYSVWLNMVR